MPVIEPHNYGQTEKSIFLFSLLAFIPYRELSIIYQYVPNCFKICSTISFCRLKNTTFNTLIPGKHDKPVSFILFLYMLYLKVKIVLKLFWRSPNIYISTLCFSRRIVPVNKCAGDTGIILWMNCQNLLPLFIVATLMNFFFRHP